MTEEQRDLQNQLHLCLISISQASQRMSHEITKFMIQLEMDIARVIGASYEQAQMAITAKIAEDWAEKLKESTKQ